MKKAAKLVCLLTLAFCYLPVSCDLFNSKKYADVIMGEGPRYDEDETTIFFTGTVHNVGAGTAKFVKVYIELRNPDDVLLAQAYNVVDKTDLKSGESSTWRVTFDDEDLELRGLMDESKTQYDITWSETEED